MPKVNLNDVEAWTGDGAGPTPDGGYAIAVEDVEEKEGPKGTYWNLTLLITDGPFADRNLYTKLFFTPKTAGGLKQALEALKVKIPAGDFDLKPAMLKNKKGHVLVRREEYQGTDDDGNTVTKSRPEVKAWGALPFATNGAAGVAALAGKFDATPEAKKATPDDDDIPFHHIDTFTLASV